MSYSRQVLFQNREFEIVSIQWPEGSLSLSHDHGWSACRVLVEAGEFENTLNMGGKIEVQRVQAGEVVNTPIGASHEMRCLREGKTLHVYSPPLGKSSEPRFSAESAEGADADWRRSDWELGDSLGISALRDLLDRLQAASISTASPFFMNQLFSGVLPQALMAQDLIARTRTTLATREASPQFSRIEAEVVERLGERIGWPAGSRDGVGVPGGSAANFMALHLARHRLFPEMKTKGMGGTALRVFVSAEAHYSFTKACVALGLGSESLIRVETDAKGRMDPDSLDRVVMQAKSEGTCPVLVAATLGTTVLGAFDPMPEISEICRKHGIWLHADAAWGAPAFFGRKLKSLISGAEFADSVTFDAHKFFGAGLTCTFFLTRHAGLLRDANDVAGGHYLFHSREEEIDRGTLSWQCGRAPDAVQFWTIWKSFGTEGLGNWVDRLVDVRNESVRWIREQRSFELIHEPEFFNLCVRVRPEGKKAQPDFHRRLRESLKANHVAMVNFSSNSQGDFLRFILVHPGIEASHMKTILEAAQRCISD